MNAIVTIVDILCASFCVEKTHKAFSFWFAQSQRVCTLRAISTPQNNIDSQIIAGAL